MGFSKTVPATAVSFQCAEEMAATTRHGDIFGPLPGRGQADIEMSTFVAHIKVDVGGDGHGRTDPARPVLATTSLARPERSLAHGWTTSRQ